MGSVKVMPGLSKMGRGMTVKKNLVLGGLYTIFWVFNDTFFRARFLVTSFPNVQPFHCSTSATSMPQMTLFFTLSRFFEKHTQVSIKLAGRALVLLLLQTLSATLLPVMVAMAAVLALRQDPEFMVQSPLSLICVRELGAAWKSISHLEHKSKGSTLAEPEVPANGELGRDQRGDRDIKERGSWSRLTDALIIKEGPTFQLWQGGRRWLHEQ